MWPFKRKPKAEKLEPVWEERAPRVVHGIPTIAQQHEDLRAEGYEPVGDEDGPIVWVKRGGQP